MIRCAASTHKAKMGNKEMTVHHLTPVFKSEDSRQDAKRKTEAALYEIFRKYMA